MDFNKYPTVKSRIRFFIYPDDHVSLKIFESNSTISLNIKKNAFIILKQCKGNITLKELYNKINEKYKISKNKLINFIKNSIKKDVIELRDKPTLRDIDIFGDGNKIFPQHISFQLTEQCNLKCTYCYNKSSPSRKNHFSLEQIKYLFELLSKNGVSVIEISGGEPLIHPNIYEIIKLSLHKFEKTVILTNGVKITEDLIKLINKNKDKFLGFQVSIDGPNEEINNKIRQIKRTFKKTISTIKILKHNDLLKRVTMVLTENNINYLEDTCRLMEKLGVSEFGFTIASELGRGSELTNISNNKRKSYKNIIRENYYDYLNNISKKYEHILLDEEEITRYAPKNLHMNCGAGWRSVAIIPNGKVKLCPLTTNTVNLGNILKDDYFNIFNSQKNKILKNFSMDTYLETECRNCPYNNQCGACINQIVKVNKKRLKNKEGLCKVFSECKLEKISNIV